MTWLGRHRRAWPAQEWLRSSFPRAGSSFHTVKCDRSEAGPVSVVGGFTVPMSFRAARTSHQQIHLNRHSLARAGRLSQCDARPASFEGGQARQTRHRPLVFAYLEPRAWAGCPNVSALAEPPSSIAVYWNKDGPNMRRLLPRPRQDEKEIKVVENARRKRHQVSLACDCKRSATPWRLPWSC